MKKNSFILVYDSGIGGLTTLSNLTHLLPQKNFIYFADTKNCPYGSKCKSQLQEIVYNNIRTLTNRSTISHIVLACNTATTATIEYLRSKINIPIIGTEPNVKEPSRLGFQIITLLATPVTVREEKLINLENTLSKKPKNIGVAKLAKLIDDYYTTNNLNTLELAKKLIDSKLKSTPKGSAIVLGCTHYVYFKDYIESLGFTCFDGNLGVAKRLKQILQENNNLINDTTKSGIIVFRTGNIKTNCIYRKIYKKYSKSLKISAL